VKDESMKAQIGKEGVAEIRKRLVGKHAYTAVIHEEKGVAMTIIGRADFGTVGYTPCKNRVFETHQEAKEFADELNQDLGLTKLEAWLIVSDTMRCGVKHFQEGRDE
jgi:hypothetical protein